MQSHPSKQQPDKNFVAVRVFSLLKNGLCAPSSFCHFIVKVDLGIIFDFYFLLCWKATGFYV